MFSPTNSLASLSLSSPINNNLRPLTSSSSALKRKRSPLSHPDDDSSATSTSRSPSAPSPSTSTPSEPFPVKQEMPELPIEPVADSGLIRCICGFTDDDGLTIFCDMCGFWQHISCVLYQAQSQSSGTLPGEGALLMDTEGDVVSTPNAAEHSPRAYSPSHSPLHPSYRSRSPSSSRGTSVNIPKPKTSSKPKPKSPSSSGRSKLVPQSSAFTNPAIPETLPEQWFCERCIPRPVDAIGARERQMARMLADRAASVSAASASAGAVTDEAELDEMVDIDEAGPSTPLPPSVNGKRRTGGGGGEKRRKSNAADNAPPSSSWGAPPPPRRASVKAGTSSSQPSGKNKRAQPSSAPSGLSKRDEDTLFEPWATEYTHIPADVVPDRRVRDQIARWAQRLLDEEEDWCHTTPLLSSGGKVPASISPLTSCIPVHPFSAVFASSVPSSAGNPNAKRVKVQVRPIPNAECTPLPSPSVCPASPVVTPTSYPFPSANGSPLPSPAGSFDSASKNPGFGGPGYVNPSAGYTRPPTYGLYTACPTAHSQQQSLTCSSSSGSNQNTGNSAVPLPYFTSTIPAGTFLAPFTSVICSLESYVTAASSQYALLQTAKPFVHLVGRSSRGESHEHDEDEPPALALDAREMGGEARWARSGCFPNAVIRPVLGFVSPSSPTAPESPALNGKKGAKPKPKKGGQAELTLSWGLYSTRPIAPRGEEIILGWEWDRCSAVHRLKQMVKDGCSDAQDESDVKTQLSQILYTLGGTFTSCACGRQNHSSIAAGEPIRECVFSVMARFVCERSRFIGKPTTTALTLSVPALPPPRSLNGSSKKSPRTPTATTPVMTPKLSIDAVFDRYRANIDLGPMVGWPDEEDERSGKVAFPLGAGPGACALSLPNSSSKNGARRRFINSSAPSSPIVVHRPCTPPPTRTPGMDIIPQTQSHSAPPHFANTNSLMATTVASAGSPLVKSHELAVQPVRRGWADVVGLNDPPNPPLLRPRAPSPSPHNVPPSVKNGRGYILGAPVHISKIALPKLQIGSEPIPGLKMQPMHQAPLLVPDSVPFAAPLPSFLGLEMESDDVATEMDMDTSLETASVATADSGFGLAEEPRGKDSPSITNADGLPVKLPPWARKRVRSTSSIAAFSPVHATPPPMPVICGTSSSLPIPSSIHDALSEPMTDITEDTEMANGSIGEESPALEPPDAKMLPAELIVDPYVMPPPPIPAALDPTTVTSISIPPSPVIEQGQPPLSAQAPTPNPDQTLIPTTDLSADCLDVTITVQDVAILAPEYSGDESKAGEEPTTPQPLPVRMSFLDWKRKREANQKEKVPEQVSATPAAAEVDDRADTLLGVFTPVADEVPEKRSAAKEEKPGPIPALNESAVTRSHDLAATRPNNVLNPAHPAIAKDIVMEGLHDELAGAGSNDGDVLPPSVETRPASSSISSSVLPAAATSASAADRFSHSSRTISSTGQRRSAEIDDEIKVPSDSEASTMVSNSSTSPPLLHSVSEEDAEDGEIIDSPVEPPNDPTGLVDVNHPPSLSVKDDSKSRCSTPSSSTSRLSPPPRRPPSPGRRRMPPINRDHGRYGPVPNGSSDRRPKFSGLSSFAPASPADPHASSVSERDHEESRYRAPPPATNGSAVYASSSPGYGPYSRRGGSTPFSSASDRWYPQRRASPPPVNTRSRDYEHRNNGWNNRGRYQRPYRGRGGGTHLGYRPTPNALRRGGHDGEDSVKQRPFDSQPRSRTSGMYHPAGPSLTPPTREPADIS